MRIFLATLLALSSTLAACGTVRAAVFCVNTVAQFQDALDAADSNFASDTIRLGAVTFIPPPDGIEGDLADGDSITIEGGWFSFNGNCNVHVEDPTLTVIDGGGLRRGLVFTTDIGNGALTVRNLTIRNTRVSGLNQPQFRGPALQVQGTNGYTGDIVIERNVFGGNVSEDLGGAVTLGTAGNIRLLNNLFTDNEAASGAAMYAVGNASVTYVNGNTIAGNRATRVSTESSLKFGGSSSVVMSNNILWGNTTPAQHDVSAADILLVANDIERLHGAGAPGSSATLSVDPRFTGADYRLDRSSPLIDAGSNSPLGGLPALDLQGDPRIGQGQVDIGAYELPLLFSDGFE